MRISARDFGDHSAVAWITDDQIALHTRTTRGASLTFSEAQEDRPVTVTVSTLDGHVVTLIGHLSGRVSQDFGNQAFSLSTGKGPVNGVAIARLNNREVIVTCGHDHGFVKAWDSSWRPVGTAQPFDSEVAGLRVGRWGSTSCVVVTASQAVAVLSELEWSNPRYLSESRAPIHAVDVGRFDETDVICTSTPDSPVVQIHYSDGTVRHLRTGLARGISSLALGRFRGKDMLLMGDWFGDCELWSDFHGTSATLSTGLMFIKVAMSTLPNGSSIMGLSKDNEMRIWDENLTEIFSVTPKQ